MDPPQDHEPLPTPLPDPLPGDFMSKAQWNTLYALLDGCLPAFASYQASTDTLAHLVLDDGAFEAALDRAAASLSGPPARARFRAFLEYRPTQNAAFRADCLHSLATAPQRSRLAGVLRLLG